MNSEQNDKDAAFEESLALGISGENLVYDYQIANYGLVEDSRSQVHGQGAGPRLVGTEGKIVSPDFCVYNKPGSPKGRFAVDVKVKNSLYWHAGKRCFTVDKKIEDYKRIVQIKQLDYLLIIFVYEGKMHFYKDTECIGKEYKRNEFGTGFVYYFEYDESKVVY
jgi:hypothetical protein